MKKILKCLKCQDTKEFIEKFKSYEVSEEIENFKELMGMVMKNGLERRSLTTLKGKQDLLDYLKINMGYKKTEEFRILYLNASNKLIKDEILFKGTVDRSVVYPRLIVEKALKYATKGIIFVHNHPSGSLVPSKKDIELTEALKKVLEVLNIKLIDHFIISDSGEYSFYMNGLI